MKIYFGHSRGIKYEDLYTRIRDSELEERHELILPHENSEKLFDSKTFLREECDLFVAEVSEASTGLGIELGWANLYNVPIVCFHQEETKPSSSLNVLTDTVESYKNKDQLIKSMNISIKKNM